MKRARCAPAAARRARRALTPPPPRAPAVLTELAGSGAIDLVVHAGDISYADNRGVTSREAAAAAATAAAAAAAAAAVATAAAASHCPPPRPRSSRAPPLPLPRAGDGGYENVQNTYWNEVSPYLSHVPGMYSSGNHGAR